MFDVNLYYILALDKKILVVYNRYMNRDKIKDIAENVQQVRRWRNNQLIDSINGVTEVYNLEDLVRLVGNLNATYQHLCSALVVEDSERALFCVYKHLSTALVQSEEVDGNTTAIYEILGEISDNKIQACGACDKDKEQEQDG